MKFLCFGYLDTEKWATLSQEEQNAMTDECFAYDQTLKKNGHWAGGEGIQGPDKVVSLRLQNGKVAVTDGPFTETKELLGGLLILEAKNIKEAVRLLSNHPGVKAGPWEIRPVQDLTPLIRESEKRRAARK